MYSKHPVFMRDSLSRIALLEQEIEDFAVKLTIRHDSPPEESFRGEIGQYLDALKCSSAYDLELHDLFDKEYRVTFIRGIAGIGKTVLSMQLIHSWVNNELFQDKLLCFFECRDFNEFLAREGANLTTDEAFIAFSLEAFGFELGDGEDILFVVDGLDELVNIHTSNTIIKDLLCRKIFGHSKIIITGRPQVESTLKTLIGEGHFQKFEIQGLSDHQIEEYVKKFNSLNSEDVVITKNANDSSIPYLPILHVPQFLHTFCCVSKLLQENNIGSTAELYCWTYYLLLKQHADKKTQGLDLASNLFSENSGDLLILSRISHMLLMKDTIYFKPCDFEFAEIRRLSEPAKCIFIKDMLDDDLGNGKRCCFAHLTLMEFLSAVYLVTNQKWIKDGEMKQLGLQLVDGCRYDGMVKALMSTLCDVTRVLEFAIDMQVGIVF